MPTIFDASTVADLINRIERLQPDAHREWGQMTPYQMVQHCIKNDRMLLGDDPYKRLFVGRLFGRMALKGLVKDDAPMEKNQPTHPEFKMSGTGSLDAVKQEWVALLKRYPNASEEAFAGFVHPFFGSMTQEQIGICAYKHTDHHLRQFGA